MKSRYLPVPLALTIAFLLASAAAGADAADPLLTPRALLRGRDFAGALRALDAIPAAQVPADGEAGYLRALGHYYAGGLDACVQATEGTASNTNSPWQRKAIFLKARALFEQKKFKESEALYAAEASRLLSESRKRDVAGVLVKFADELATEPPKNALDATPPNYDKACNLYSKVLEMQIGREQRAEVVFKRALALEKAKKYGEAAQGFTGYLEEFDPDWTYGGSSAGAPRLRQENPPPPGAQRLQARCHLADAQIVQEQFDAARRGLEDLQRMTEGGKGGADAPLAVDIQWMLVRTYALPKAADFENGVRAARRFLELYPADRRAVRAAFDIAESYRNAGRSDGAIKAYREFMEGKIYRLPDGAAATEKDAELNKSPAELKDEWEKIALHSIGTLLFGQAKYDEAIAEWQSYVTRFPNGPQWSECQEGIVNAEYQKGLRALSDKKQDEARALFEKFLAAHPLDGRARQILFIFGQVRYARAQELEEQKAARGQIDPEYRTAVEEWSRLISKYPDTEESSLALYRTGQVQEEKLGELEKALESYRRLTWGSCQAQAQQRIGIMTAKELTLTTERKFRAGEKAVVKIRARNVEKITLKQYTLDLEAYFRKTHGTGGVEGLDTTLIQPDCTRELKLDGYAKYKPLDQDVEVAFEAGRPGVCVVTVSEEDWEATTLVIRSDLDVIAKSSRREALVFVEDKVGKKPAEGVKILLSDGKTVFATGTTGKDGVFRQKCPELNEVGELRVFAVRDGHTAAQNVPVAGLQTSSGLKPRGYVYTDRPLYRPGAAVAVRGILRDVQNGSYAVPQDEFTVSVLDSKSRLVREEKLKLSEFGTFNTALTLPENAPEGDYTVMARADRKNRDPLVFSGTFSVRIFTPAKIRMALDFPRTVYFRGETVEATLDVQYYWGEPVPGRLVRYTLPDGRSFVDTTDAKGRISFRFDTTSMRPGLPLPFAASLEGEDVSVQDAVVLAREGFSVKVEPAQKLVLAGEPVDVLIAASAADGKPAAEELTLTVVRSEQPKPDPILKNVPWLACPEAAPAEVTVQELKVKTDAATGKCVQSIRLEKGGTYALRVTGTDRYQQVITRSAALEVSDAEDATKLRLFAESSALKVGAHAALRLHSRLTDGLALVTHEGEDVLGCRIVPVRGGYNDIGFDVGHEHFPNFRVAVAMMDGRELRSASKDFTVERELKVAVKPLKESFAPGENGKVELTVTDQLGKPVRAELSLALVDEGVFAVQADRTPAILGFFQTDARRHAEFRVESSCGYRYAGVTRKVSKEIQEETARLERGEREAAAMFDLSELRKHGAGKPAFTGMPVPGSGVVVEGQLAQLSDFDADGLVNSPVVMKGIYASRSPGRRGSAQGGFGGGGAAPAQRRELPDEGRWFPDAITDAEGKATVTVAMPEKTTEWRLTARGCSVETLVGEARSKTLTKKDFFVEIKAPRTVQEGDAIRVLARIHNGTDYAGLVQLRLGVRSLGVTNDTNVATLEKSCEVKAKSGAEVTFDSFVVPAAAGLALRLEASAGAQRDALALDVPVRAYGLEFAAQGGGVSSSDAALFLQLPPDRKYSSTWMMISVGPDLAQSVVDLALSDAMPRFRMPELCLPWGGTDGSELLARASGLEYARAVRSAEADRKRLVESVRGLAGGLTASQRDDGGWAWEGVKAGSDWAASARAYWALVRARDLGVPVHTDAVARAQAYLQGAFQSFGATDNDAKAVVLHALSVSKSADFANCNRLHRERSTMGNAALAYLALAFLNLDRPDFAKELLDLLESRGEATAAGTRKMLSWDPKAPHEWMKDRMETTALVLLALSKGRPASPAASAAAEYLMNERGCCGISPAKARGPVVAALAAWYGQGKAADTDCRIDLEVNGQLVTNLVGKGAQATVYVPVGSDLLVAGTNRVAFKMAGRGQYAYAATLRGFSPEIKDPGSWSYPYPVARRYYHSQLEYRGRPIGVNSTSAVTNLEAGQRTDVLVDIWDHPWPGYMAVEESLPAGAALVEGSLSGNFSHYELGPSRIVLYYAPGSYVQDFRYQLIGNAPGRYRALPTVMRDALNPSRQRIGPGTELTVLAPGEKSPDPFQINKDELFALGRLYFEDGVYDKALENLAELFKRDRAWQERETARMLLWIHTLPEHYDARRIVEMFEILRERYPQLEIPFGKILVVGKAYRDIGEFERASLVYRATIGAGYINDSGVSAVLHDEGRLLGSVDYQEALWREYPDTAEVVSSYFALAQTLCQQAPEAHKLPKEGDRVPEKIQMLVRGADMLNSFLAMYPNDPLADDAAFSICNTWLDLKLYGDVVARSAASAALYTNSTLVSSLQYMTALGYFWQHQHRQALDAARGVADGDSADRDFAGYIVGQIYHAEGKPADAIAWYGKVREKYRDAAEAIGYFEEKRIALDEVTTLRPGEPVNLKIRYRNIREAFLQVYKVDLMKLCLREKNLSNITQVRLAGIKPQLELTVPFGDGKDYVEKEGGARLDIKDEGAYLVICRGDDLFASGLVLITPLKIEVQEDVASGQARANVLDAVKGGYRAGVHVKAIGSEDKEFKSGETDLRGIFAADGLQGKATVIAREGQTRYAFYRGERWIGAPKAEARPPAQPAAPQQLDFQYNLRQQQQAIQGLNGLQFENMRRTKNSGVEVQQAF